MQTATHLQEKIEYLELALDEKNTILEEKNQYILQLEEHLKQQRYKQFSASSEKLSPDQLGLFKESLIKLQIFPLSAKKRLFPRLRPNTGLCFYLFSGFHQKIDGFILSSAFSANINSLN